MIAIASDIIYIPIVENGGQVEVAPKKQTGGLRHTGLLFEFLRTPIPPRLVQPLAVIEAFEVLMDRLTGLGLILELAWKNGVGSRCSGR